ncbi:hypothetical protein SRIMM317S_03177 [Streptomyces rimosus subsp. rimosus]
MAPTLTRERSAPLEATNVRAAAGSAARSCTVFVRTSTAHEDASGAVRCCAARSNLTLAASSWASEWEAWTARAPAARTAARRAVSVVATVSVPDSVPLTQAPAKDVPSAFFRCPATAPASASLASRRSACARFRPRSRCIARYTASDVAPTDRVSAADRWGVRGVVESGRIWAAAEPGSAVRTSAPTVVMTAHAPARACLWRMGEVSSVSGGVEVRKP